MIDAKELRIGNHILNENGDLIIVESVSREFNYTDKKRYDDVCNYVIENGEIKSCVDLSRCIPIKLTEHMLVKRCGLCEMKDTPTHTRLYTGAYHTNSVFLLDAIWLRSPVDGSIEEVPHFRHGHFKIKSLHQLQNLYYSLTGEELEIL